MTQLPRISILTPTLNSERVLSEYFEAIELQDYPSENLEVVIADGGSEDATVHIARSHGAHVVRNALMTAEAGKRVAFERSSGDLVLLLDSDNVLVGRNWLRAMVAPFTKPEIVGAEPLRFCAEPGDSLVDRYCAAVGAGDPLCLFLGNYDRYSAVTGSWTGLKVEYANEDYGLSLSLDQPLLPTIGANGTLYRRVVLDEYFRWQSNDRRHEFDDVDIPHAIGRLRADPIFAKVDIPIRHLYCRDVATFVRKQKRRIRDYLSSGRDRAPGAYPWRRFRPKIAVFCAETLLGVPLLWQAVLAYSRSGERACFFHPVACWLTLFTYGTNALFAGRRRLSRRGWSQ